MRFLVCCVLAGCGRIAFDAHTAGDGPTDGVTGLPLGRVALPEGGSIYDFQFDPTGPARYALTNRGVYRATDTFVWTPCGDLRAQAIGVDATGRPYAAADTDVYASGDGCATWQLVPGGHYTNALGATASQMLALTDTGVYALPGWTLVSTPFDGDPTISIGANTDRTEIVVGSLGNGAIRSANGGATWAPASSGLSSLVVRQIAISPQDKLRAYAIEGDATSSNGEIACSTTGGATWAQCFPNGGETIAVDPTNPLHVLAAPYDEFLESVNGFTSYRNDVRGHDLDESRVHALAFTAAGVPMVGTDRGVFAATDSALSWVAHHTGLDAWSVQRILDAGDDIYVGTYGGLMVSRAGGPFTLSTVGLTGNTNIRAMLLASSPTTLFSVGLRIRRSDDLGQTWTEVFSTTTADSYYATSIAQLGTRLIVGTAGRTLTSDPPWTTWTPRLVAGATHNVNALLVHGTTLFLAADSGLYQSVDQGATYTRIPAVMAPVKRLALMPDDRILAGTDTTMYVSDATGATWQATSLAGHVVDLAVQGATIVAALQTGVRVSHDTGATWTTVAGFDTLSPMSVAFEPSGTLLVGADGSGLTRVAAP